MHYESLIGMRTYKSCCITCAIAHKIYSVIETCIKDANIFKIVQKSFHDFKYIVCFVLEKTKSDRRQSGPVKHVVPVPPKSRVENKKASTITNTRG